MLLKSVYARDQLTKPAYKDVTAANHQPAESAPSPANNPIWSRKRITKFALSSEM